MERSILWWLKVDVSGFAMRISIVLNFVFFQALWFSCVVAAGAYGYYWLAFVALIPISVLTWFSETRKVDFIVAFTALALGVAIDNLWVALGILSYPGISYAPVWIALLWIGLGLTINHSMALFRDRTLIGSLVVGVFAPVTYLTGQRFEAVVIEQLPLTALISVAWFVLFYALAKLALRMIGDVSPDHEGDLHKQ